MPCQNKDDHPHGWSFLFSLGILKDLNPKWACTVKKNSPGDCFLGARCEDGYQNQQDFGRQAVQIRQKADLCPSAPAKDMDTTKVVSISFCMSRATNPRHASVPRGEPPKPFQYEIQQKSGCD